MIVSSLAAYRNPCLSPLHLRVHVIRPMLTYLAGAGVNLGGAAAEELLLGTAAQESKLRALDQVTSRDDQAPGPALGLWQMEPATHADILKNFLAFKPELGARVESLLAPWPARDKQLISNLAYAAAMARIHYYRVREPLPAAGDVQAQAAYWKKYYNTSAGKGEPAHYVQSWNELVAPYV